jgi:signal transduction histidine kinase
VYDDLLLGVFNALGTCAGMFFVGAAAHAQKRAEEAGAESRRLLAELQDAHRRLQEYAAHAEQLAAEQERNRLAREVHDTLGHRLTVAAVQLEGAQKLIARDPEKAARMVETVRREVAEGLAELRGTVAMLRAPLDGGLSIAAAVTRLAARFQEATGVAVTLDLPPALPPVSPDQRQALYRAVQEALTNVQRHAHAQHVAVRFQVDAAMLRVTVEDDGAGLPADAAGRGYGLRGLRERAEALGGRFAATPLPGGGTQVCFEVPLLPAASE